MSKAQLNFDDLRLRAAIMRGVVNGVNSVSLDLATAVKLKLSQPGGGRVYIRGKTARRALRKSGFKIGSRKSLNRSAAVRLLLDRRLKGLKNRSLRKLGFHKASAPGQPPAADTGNLRRSWQVGFANPKQEQSQTKYLLRVGSNMRYARRLEFGGGHIAARPYIRPAIEEIRPKAKAIIVEAIRAELAKFVRARGGKP